MANYNNYSISGGKGKFYLKSKEPQEGYEKITYGTNNDVTYHKYFSSIEGTLKYFDTKEAQTKDGKKLQFLEVTFINGDDYNKVSVPLKNSKGNYTDEVKGIVSALNSAEIGEEYTMSLKNSKYKSANGKEYDNLAVYLNYKNRKNDQGKGLSTGFIPNTDIPRPEKEEDEDLGVSWNWKPVNKFYAQKIKETKERFESNSSSQAPTQSTKEESTKVESPTHLDLPF